MRTEVLRYLIEIDKQSSMSKAANELYISKSALSESVSQLERELNVAIFERTKKGVVTTEAGQRILEQARVILENVDKMYQASFNAPPLINFCNTITFGVGEKFALSGLSECINLILNKYPDITINAIDMNAKQSFENLIKHEIQFAITGCTNDQKAAFFSQFHEHNIKCIMLPDDPISVVANRSSPLAQKDYLMLNDYKDYRIVTYSNVSDCSADVFQNNIYLSTFDNILQVLNANGGISFFPHSLIQSLHLRQIDNLVFIPVIDLIQSNFMIYSSNQPMPEIQWLFMMMYKRMFEKRFVKQ